MPLCNRSALTLAMKVLVVGKSSPSGFEKVLPLSDRVVKAFVRRGHELSTGHDTASVVSNCGWRIIAIPSGSGLEVQAFSRVAVGTAVAKVQLVNVSSEGVAPGAFFAAIKEESTVGALNWFLVQQSPSQTNHFVLLL